MIRRWPVCVDLNSRLKWRKTRLNKKHQILQCSLWINTFSCIFIVSLGGFGHHHTHRCPSARLTGFTRAIIIYSIASLSMFVVPPFLLHLLPHWQMTSGSFNMCRVVGRADDFWEASSRRLTWRCKRRPIITATIMAAWCAVKPVHPNNHYPPSRAENSIFQRSRTPLAIFDSIR